MARPDAVSTCTTWRRRNGLRFGVENESCTERNSSRFKHNRLAEMWSGSEEGSYPRLLGWCITHL